MPCISAVFCVENCPINNLRRALKTHSGWLYAKAITSKNRSSTHDHIIPYSKVSVMTIRRVFFHSYVNLDTDLQVVAVRISLDKTITYCSVYLPNSSLSIALISHTGICMTFYLSIILDLQNFFH